MRLFSRSSFTIRRSKLLTKFNLPRLKVESDENRHSAQWPRTAVSSATDWEKDFNLKPHARHFLQLRRPSTVLDIMAREYLQFLGLCALFSLVIAAPQSNSGEIYYLVNCAPCQITAANCQYTYSTMAYYAHQSGSENQEMPDAIVPAAPAPALVIINWEGNTVQGAFSATNIFNATIAKDAKNKVLFNLVGNGTSLTREYSGVLKDMSLVPY